MSTSTNETPSVIITVTETIVSKYRVTEEQLRELDLPFDVTALREEDGDDLATSLEEHLDAADYAVTDRDVDIHLAQP